MPPSVNQLFATDFKTRRRFKTKEFAAWERLASTYMLLKPRLEMQGDVVSVYAYGKPSNRRMDVANREKGVSDLLVKHGILKDDSQIVDIRLYWASDVEAGMVRVELRSVSKTPTMASPLPDIS